VSEHAASAGDPVVSGTSDSPRIERWIMRQSWHDLLFMHWPVPPEQLRRFVPPGLELDTFDGHAWVGVVPFRMSGVRLRGLPALPGASAFPELNVRTYVRRGDRAGVLFQSLDAASRLAVRVARGWFRLPYFDARMRCEPDGEAVAYASTRNHSGAPAAELRCRYAPTGPPVPPAPGSLEFFLTERYSLFTTGRGGRLIRGDIWHPPWPLQPAELELERNTMAAAHGIALPDRAPLLHFARLQEVEIARPRPCDGRAHP
jgi:uncharacterized protein YqjF (DUF2071 family)